MIIITTQFILDLMQTMADFIDGIKPLIFLIAGVYIAIEIIRGIIDARRYSRGETVERWGNINDEE
ncbi:MAG: hypothetical protein WC428_08530 [Candidatus Paceibacterota bacterium]|jgi:hypothetical protein